MVELITDMARQLARATSAEALAGELGQSTPNGDGSFSVRPEDHRLGTLRVAGDPQGAPLHVDITLSARSGLRVEQLKAALGAWKELPKVSWTSPSKLAFPWIEDAGAPATVAPFARLPLGAPVSDAALVEQVTLRRDAR